MHSKLQVLMEVVRIKDSAGTYNIRRDDVVFSSSAETTTLLLSTPEAHNAQDRLFSIYYHLSKMSHIPKSLYSF